ncbi:hypothetical protein [Streptomyces sp. NPDC050564]|uniref:hypothetical protein n=1 Tax=Streptomyces sp. NPDC050564 TaxID=3365631 RepID=UPI0037B6233B
MSWQSGEPEAAPRVYLPQSDGEAPPAYETYTDPAEAHGWQKGYEEGGDGAPRTREAYEDGDDTLVQAAVPGDPTGRRDRLLRRRRARLLRRLSVAGGAVCVVLLALVISGAFDSGSSKGSGGPSREPASPPHLATGAVAPTEGSAATAGTSAGPSSTTSPGASGSAGAASGSPRAAPSASASTAPATSAPATATSTTEGGRGNSNGHGQGATKRPK